MPKPELSVERLSHYTFEDAAGIGRLMPFLSKSRGAEPIPEELLTEIINSPHHEQLVARLDSIIVGAATLNILMGPAAGRLGYLEDFVTDPEAQGRGIGSRIWNEMMRWCDEHQVNLEFTSKATRETAHKFYLSRGAVIRETAVFRVNRGEE